MTGQSENKPIHVSILALPESTPVAIYGLYEVFSSVGVVWPELTGEGEAAPRFDVKIVSLDGKPFTCPIGITIAPNASIADIAETDVVIATDLALPPGFEPGDRWPEMSEWLRARHRDGAIVCSVCTGTVLLAVAGVLDGEDATTHWSACDLFARYFPNVALRPERIVVPAGEGHRVITSGGSSSWEDLALYVIGRLCGPAEAIRTAKIFLFGDRSDGRLDDDLVNRPAQRVRHRLGIAEAHDQVGRQPSSPSQRANSRAFPGTSSGWLMKAWRMPSAVAASAKRWQARPASTQCALSLASETTMARPADERICARIAVVLALRRDDEIEDRGRSSRAASDCRNRRHKARRASPPPCAGRSAASPSVRPGRRGLRAAPCWRRHHFQHVLDLLCVGDDQHARAGAPRPARLSSDRRRARPCRHRASGCIAVR
jgi:transcriptional regulator GlxA family with amidase domain